MIYDCFPFFNELDILEIRLAELYHAVDRFVLVEATKTFQRKPKPLFFKENEKRFAPYRDKITHIVLDNYPGFFSKFRVPTGWDMSHNQKNAVAQGLSDAGPGDKIIISDLDEIPRAEKILQYKDLPGIKVFEQRFYYFYLNYLAIQGPPGAHLVQREDLLFWKGTVMLDFKDFQNFGRARNYHDRSEPEVTCVREGGWHFSYMGGVESVILKLRSFEHANEERYFYHPEKDLGKVTRKMEHGEDLFDMDFRFMPSAIDDTYPAEIRNNTRKYDHLIKKQG